MVLFSKGRSDPVPILMARHPTEFQVLAVQEEAFFPVHMVIPQADVILHPVNLLPVF